MNQEEAVTLLKPKKTKEEEKRGASFTRLNVTTCAAVF